MQIPILELAELHATIANLPDDLKGGLDTMGEFVSPQMSFPNGCHVCEVEIDPATGEVTVVGYVAVDDVGTIVHRDDRRRADAWRHRAGLGQVLGEQIVYARTGSSSTRRSWTT